MRLLILVLFIWSSSIAFASGIPAPRIGKYPGYSRVVVDLPPDAAYRIELNLLAMKVIFPSGIVVADIKKYKYPEFLGYTLEQNADSGVLTLVTPQGVTSRSGWRLQVLAAGEGKTGSRLVIDFSGAFSDTSPLGLLEPFVFKPENLARNFSVVVDPGHGGTDPGARGVLQESEVNLSVSTRVARGPVGRSRPRGRRSAARIPRGIVRRPSSRAKPPGRRCRQRRRPCSTTRSRTSSGRFWA